MSAALPIHNPARNPCPCMHLQGQFPDNAQSFWKFLLRKSLPPDSLSGLQYAVFGLGDSGYPKYNVREGEGEGGWADPSACQSNSC